MNKIRRNKMYVLTLLNYLPERQDNKSGLYPVLIKNQKDVALLCADINDSRDIRPECVDLDCMPIFPASMPTIRFFIKCLLVLPRDNYLSWLVFFIRYMNLFGAVDEFFHRKGLPAGVFAAQSSVITGRIALIINKIYSVDYIVWEHLTVHKRNVLKPSTFKAVKKVFDGAIHVCAVTSCLKDVIHDKYGLPNEKVSILSNPCPDEAFLNAKLDHDCESFKKGRFCFSAWTNWREIKRLDRLLESFKIVKSKYPNVCLMVAGDISESGINVETIDGLSQDVLFVGKLGRGDLYSFINTANCVVISSDHETFGLPVIEAMAAGKPVVATRCGGPEDIVTSDDIGLIVDKDSVSLSEGMINMIVNYHMYDNGHIVNYCKKEYSENSFRHKVHTLMENNFRVGY